MIPISAVHPLGLVDDEISGDSLATGQVGEPVAEDEVDNVDRGPGQWQKEAKLETGLQFSLASVALATALHRRRQKLERKKLWTKKELEKKHGKGASAMDIVRAEIQKKYGKGAIMDKKKKDK